MIRALVVSLLAAAGAQAQAQPAPEPAPTLSYPAGRYITPNRRVQTAVVQEAGEETLTWPKTQKFLKTGAQMGGRAAKEQQENIDFAVRTELPDPGELFRRLSEAQVQETIRQDARKYPGSGRVVFPQEPVIGRGPYEGRQFRRMCETVEPSYICHRRLLFEQPNFERHTWSAGAVQPIIHLGIFYYDMVMLPYHIWERPCEDFDCTAGKCLPGDPTPFLLYRERFSLSGMAAEIGTFWLGSFFR